MLLPQATHRTQTYLLTSTTVANTIMPTCEFPRCNQEATFCFADEPNVRRFCANHRDDTMTAAMTCEFPRCSEEPLYTFVDDIATPHFCQRHKSPEMILANGVQRPGVEGAVRTGHPEPTTPTSTTGPSQASLELAYSYFALKPEYDSLETIQQQAQDHQSKLDGLKSKVQTEVRDIHKTSKSIEQLEQQIQKQETKFIDCFGKSIFGFGLLMKDQKVIDKKAQALTLNEEKKAQLDKAKAQDESSLAALQTEQARLDELVEIRRALEARVQELRSTCLEYEGTTELRKLQSQHQTHQRLQESLEYCRHDVAKAHKMFLRALDIQAVAARSNAMATGANLGQALGGGGGRGIGSSPGERLLQIRRNQATKHSIELSKQAAEKLNTAQDRLNNELRVKFPEGMNGVGIIQVPDLWHGNFFRDFLVGQAAGNIGDAINQGRAGVMIRKNMKTLEKLIDACASQEKQLERVSAELDRTTNAFQVHVSMEEKRILETVIEAAKKAQAAHADA